jgi:hypothetical protein
VVVLIAAIIVIAGCTNDEYVGSTDTVTVRIIPGKMCNVELQEPSRHGRNWYSLDTLPADEQILEGELEFDAEDHAVFRASNGVTAEFRGSEDNMVPAGCPVPGG